MSQPARRLKEEMARHAKLLDRLCSRPKDFTWNELARLLAHFGYTEKSGSGSRRKFVTDEGTMISLHKPHPGSILKAYQIDAVLAHLRQENLI